jgi:hypothetical protein
MLLSIFPHLLGGTMATSQTCCHLPGEMLNSAAECADRARISLSLLPSPFLSSPSSPFLSLFLSLSPLCLFLRLFSLFLSLSVSLPLSLSPSLSRSCPLSPLLLSLSLFISRPFLSLSPSLPLFLSPPPPFSLSLYLTYYLTFVLSFSCYISLSLSSHSLMPKLLTHPAETTHPASILL